MNSTQLLYAMALQAVPNIGDITAKKLIQHCGTPEAVFKASKRSLERIYGIESHTIKTLQNAQTLKSAERELKFIDKHNINAFYFEETAYPHRLKHCVDGPIVLFQKGSIKWDKSPVISIVGTRQLTAYGARQCRALVAALSVFNPIIVSGLAYGADIIAHRAALECELQTVACMAQDLQNIYPAAHKKFRSQIEAHGGFVTDFWSTSQFSPSNFVRRNRLIAGLSEATVVIESGVKGGSLITADLAFGYNREVFALPGRIGDSQSVGCLNLIKTKKAHLLSVPEDLPYILNWNIEAHSKSLKLKTPTSLNIDEKLIFEHLKKEGTTPLDLIALGCQIPTSKAAYILLNLELKGVVKSLPGNVFGLF